MISHYTAIVGMSVAAMISFIIGINGDSFVEDDRRKWFILLAIALIFANISEWLAAILDGNIDWIWLRVIAKFVELSLTPTILLVASYTMGVGKLTKYIQVLTVFNLVLQIVSLFNGAVFSIDGASIYHRNVLYSLYVVVYLMASVLLFFHFYGFAKKYQLANLPLLIAIFNMEIMAIVVQLLFSYLHLDWSFISFSVVLFYFYILQLLQQTDSLTGLLNRRIYKVHIQKNQEHGVVIMMDINKFKQINDTYGHKVGDECIKAVADELRNVFSGVGQCYRYGGDEFVVLMKKNLDQVETYLNRLNNSLKQKTLQNGICLPSIAHGCIGLDGSKKYAELMEIADQKMYENKRKMHAKLDK